MGNGIQMNEIEVNGNHPTPRFILGGGICGGLCPGAGCVLDEGGGDVSGAGCGAGCAGAGCAAGGAGGGCGGACVGGGCGGIC